MIKSIECHANHQFVDNFTCSVDKSVEPHGAFTLEAQIKPNRTIHSVFVCIDSKFSLFFYRTRHSILEKKISIVGRLKFPLIERCITVSRHILAWTMSLSIYVHFLKGAYRLIWWCMRRQQSKNIRIFFMRALIRWVAAQLRLLWKSLKGISALSGTHIHQRLSNVNNHISTIHPFWPVHGSYDIFKQKWTKGHHYWTF